MDSLLKSGCPWSYLLILVPAALAMTFISTLIIRRKRMVHKPSSIVVNAMFTLVRPSQPQRQKYQAPVPEHSRTAEDVADKDIHANHLEAFNASMRRRNSAFRRKANTYAKSRKHLQKTLDVFWVVHNFVRVHFTIGVVPAVKLGIVESGISWSQLLTIRYAL